jgi:hypothetical protein
MTDYIKKHWKICLFATAFWLLLAVQPMVSTYIVNLEPPMDGLTEVRGVVIKTARKDPHITVRLDSGEVKDFEFPVFLNSLGANEFTTPFGESNQDLLGCHVVMKVSIPKFTYSTRRRIWDMDCNNGAYLMEKKRIETNYWRLINAAFYIYGSITLLLMPLAFVFHIRNHTGGRNDRSS